MGGTPLNRQKMKIKVDTIAKIFSEKESFRLADCSWKELEKKLLNGKQDFITLHKKLMFQ